MELPRLDHGHSRRQQYPPPYPAKKKLPTTNPGPGNYNSALTLGKHNPAWKYLPLQSESVAQPETPPNSTTHQDQETITSATPNQDPKLPSVLNQKPTRSVKLSLQDQVTTMSSPTASIKIHPPSPWAQSTDKESKTQNQGLAHTTQARSSSKTDQKSEPPNAQEWRTAAKLQDQASIPTADPSAQGLSTVSQTKPNHRTLST